MESGMSTDWVKNIRKAAQMELLASCPRIFLTNFFAESIIPIKDME